MNFARTLQVPFDVNKELPAEQYAVGLRPTVSVLVRNPLGQVLLVYPRKAEEHADVFMFPQGAINRHETPLQAAVRILHQECTYVEANLDVNNARALGVTSVVGEKETKVHYSVFVSLRKKCNPILNYENRKYLFASGPNFLWSKIVQCRPVKRKMIISAVFSAVQAGLLQTDRWHPDRFQNLRGFGAIT